MQSFRKRKETMSSKKRVHHVIAILLFIIYIGFVTYLCFGHPPKSVHLPHELWGLPFDKCVHFLMFFPYPLLAHDAFYFKNKWRALVFAILTGLVLCFTMELLQDKITTYRTTDPWDLSINVASVTISSIITAVLALFRK